jgi:hypothetical protein
MHDKTCAKGNFITAFTKYLKGLRVAVGLFSSASGRGHSQSPDKICKLGRLAAGRYVNGRKRRFTRKIQPMVVKNREKFAKKGKFQQKIKNANHRLTHCQPTGVAIFLAACYNKGTKTQERTEL